jgi:hypothetical protein
VDTRIDVLSGHGLPVGVSSLINDGRPFLAHTHLDLGLSRKQLYEAAKTGSVRPIYRGCHVDARVPDSRPLRIESVDLVRPSGAIACNETAAFLFGIDAYRPSERHLLTPSFVVPHATSRIRRPSVRCRQAILPAADITSVDGVPVTTPLRTVSDLLRRLYRPYALSSADAFARADLIAVDEVIDYVHSLKGYRWIVQARSLAVLIDGRAESPGESWQRLRIHDAGFPPPTPQFEVVDVTGLLRRLDLAYPELLIGSEYDGREFHTLRDDLVRDQERRDDLTERFGWRWVNADRSRIFGPDPTFELELGVLLDIPPLLPRRWGTR